MTGRTLAARDNIAMSSTPSVNDARRRRWWRVGAAALAVLVLLAVAWQFAMRQLEREIVARLGPRGEVASVSLSWNGVELRGLRIAAAPKSGWPAADELHAERVVVTPDLWAALRGRIGVHRIAVDGGYIALLRTRDGQLRVLPSLLGDSPGRRDASPADTPTLRIGEVRLRDTEVAWFDQSVRQPPLALRLTGIDARIGPLPLPALDAATAIDLQAMIEGSRTGPRGKLSIDGEVTHASRDADLKVQLRQVDLVVLQPYLNRVADGGVKAGRLDLDLRAKVQRQHLHAPGRVTLTGLELGSGGFAGLPRQALVAAASQNGPIELDFTLEGRLDDPAFSLNENLATRFAAALAEKLGLSVGGVVEGVGSVIKGLFGR